MGHQLTPNPPGKRLVYVAKQFKNYPAVIFDVVRMVSRRIGERDWASKFVAAAAEADPKLLRDMVATGIAISDGSDLQGAQSFYDRYGECVTRYVSHVPFDEGESHFTHRDRTARECDKIWSGAAQALVAAVNELPAFRAPHEIDPFIAWGTQELIKIVKLIDPEVVQHEAVERYDDLLGALRDSEDLIPWFRKKKPDLTKMSGRDLLDALEKWEEDRVPETVFEWDDGWKVVKLTTSTQLDRVGTALRNCLQRSSSYHGGFCEKMQKGRADYYALLGRRGEPVVSVEWPKNDKSPSQVYAADNEEPDGVARERIAEWIESKGGEYGEKDPYENLDQYTRRIAEYIREHSPGMDDDDVIGYAESWNENFSADSAIAWIEQVGEGSYEFAGVLEGIGLDAEDWSRVIRPVRYWIDEMHSRGDDIDDDLVRQAILASTIFEGMVEGKAERARNAPRPSWQTAFEFRGEPKPRPVAALPPKLLEQMDDMGQLQLFREAWVWAGAWMEASADAKDWADEAVGWWTHHFSPEEAALYEFSILDERGNSIPLEVALELRDRGITAYQLAEAKRVVPRTFNVKSADDLQRLVEQYTETMRVNPSRRRRSSRRPNARKERRVSRRS